MDYAQISYTWGEKYSLFRGLKLSLKTRLTKKNDLDHYPYKTKTSFCFNKLFSEYFLSLRGLYKASGLCQIMVIFKQFYLITNSSGIFKFQVTRMLVHLVFQLL